MGKAYVYVGTNSIRGSQGIYTLSLDTGSGKMDVLGTAEAQDSAYLCVNRDGSRLYAVMESLEYEGKKQTAGMGSFVLLDCYRPHAYYSDTGWESIWCHFDGQMARAYYDLTVSYLGNIFTLVDDYPVLNKMTAIYQTFAEGRPIREALLSKQLTDIWTALLMDQAERPGSGKVGRVSVWEGDSIGMENVISYINEHFTGKITIQTLAEQAMLSQYHFIRMFKSYTSFTPHEYIVNIRISAAKYMLKNTSLSVKDIGLDAGFPSESAFCTAFK